MGSGSLGPFQSYIWHLILLLYVLLREGCYNRSMPTCSNKIYFRHFCPRLQQCLRQQCTPEPSLLYSLWSICYLFFDGWNKVIKVCQDGPRLTSRSAKIGKLRVLGEIMSRINVASNNFCLGGSQLPTSIPGLRNDGSVNEAEKNHEQRAIDNSRFTG